jgi:hypothetical protein
MVENVFDSESGNFAATVPLVTVLRPHDYFRRRGVTNEFPGNFLYEYLQP